MIKFVSCFGMLETEGPLLSPRIAARLAGAFASTLSREGRVLMIGDGSPEARPAMLACQAQFSFMGHPAAELREGLPCMLHFLVPHGGFAGGMGFSRDSCWLIGPDGRCPNEAMWACILARYDGGVPETLPHAVPDLVLDEHLADFYYDHLLNFCSAERIRGAGLRVGCCGLPDHARFSEKTGVEMIPFSSPEAAAEAMPYLNAACGMIFDPSGKKLTLIGGKGTCYTPDAAVLLGSFIALENGEKSLVSGGMMTRSYDELLLHYGVTPEHVEGGEGCILTYGDVCGDISGEFSFGSFSGYDALRTAVFLLDFLAAGNSLEEQLNKLYRYHLRQRTLSSFSSSSAGGLHLLKGRFNAEKTIESPGMIAFDFADGRLLAAEQCSGGVLISSEARKLQDAESRLESACAVLKA